MLASAITDLPGASDFFWGSIVSYSESAKMDVLGVDPEILARFGAVSRETVLSMLRGVSRLSSAEFCVSITGYAGPGGGEADKPVGTVWIGMTSRGGEPEAMAFLFPGDRTAIRMAATRAAISMVLDRFSD
jgi:PncC family amidohydrolase